MASNTWRSSRQSKTRTTDRGRCSPTTICRPRLEFLEVRTLLTFADPVSYNIGSQPSQWVDGVATGDFAGNGLQDLAVVHSVDATVSILMNNGDGTFQPAVGYATGSSGPDFVSVADFNGDGILDLAVIGRNSPSDSSGRISILMGNGDGTFQPAVTYAAGPGSWGGLAVGDFNGDGAPDLAMADWHMLDANHSSIAVMMNNGDGSFQAPFFVPVPLGVHFVATGDFNGDGRADLAACDGFGSDGNLDHDHPAGVTILLSNGDGTFQTAGQYDSPATPGGGVVTPYYVTTGDVLNRGVTDVIVSDYDHNINIFLGNGDGTFQQPIGVDTGEYPRFVSVVDVNNDGIPDLVVGNIGNSNEVPPSHGSVAVLLGKGDGTFQDPVQYSPFNYPSTLAVADFNGDGLPDIAVTGAFDSHAVDVLINIGDPAPDFGATIPPDASRDFAAATNAALAPAQVTDRPTAVERGEQSALIATAIADSGGNEDPAVSHTRLAMLETFGPLHSALLEQLETSEGLF
jgi:hypothetical protein